MYLFIFGTSIPCIHVTGLVLSFYTSLSGFIDDMISKVKGEAHLDDDFAGSRSHKRMQVLFI